MRATPGAGGMRSLWPALRSASSLQSKPPTRIFSPGAATGDGPRGQEYCLAINFLNFFDLPGPRPSVEVGFQEWPNRRGLKDRSCWPGGRFATPASHAITVFLRSR